jgi:TonB family protein
MINLKLIVELRRITIAVLSTLTLLCTISVAQVKEHAGIALYRQGNYTEAIKVLNDAVKKKEGKTDANLWNALGLSQTAMGKFKEAKKSYQKALDFDKSDSIIWTNLAYVQLRLHDLNGAQSATNKAVQLDPKNVHAYFIRGLASLWEKDLKDAQKNVDQIMLIDRKFAQGYVLGAWVQVGLLGDKVDGIHKIGSIRDHISYLKNAVDILQQGAVNCADCVDKGVIEKELESLEIFYKQYSKEPPTPPFPAGPPPPEPGVTSYRILSKPRASYTDAARQANISGKVRLVVLLGANGRIEYVFILNRIGHGLDEAAVAAAKAIKFVPKMKDGKPVTAAVTIEYGFSIY